MALKEPRLYSLIIVYTLLSVCHTCLTGHVKYPVARKENFDTLVYDTKISDEYSWMSRAVNEKEMLIDNILRLNFYLVP